MTSPDSTSSATNHGGILIPLDMYRPTMLAAMLGEYFVSKVRNILDAKLTLTRHAEAQIVKLGIEGSVVEGDEAKFWHENVELVAVLSQAIPRQCFLYYAATTPEKRQGFAVAQQGQVLAMDDATADQLPKDATEADWPVAKLCAQIGLRLEELAEGFPGGPRIEVSLSEPSGDDRELLMTLATPPEGAEAAAEHAEGPADNRPGASPDASPQSASAHTSAVDPAPAAAASAPTAARPSADEDRKRRIAEKRNEEDERSELARKVEADLPFEIDDFGIITAPGAELTDTDILARYIVPKVDDDLPPGLPREQIDHFRGKRIDIAVVVEFLSEVFFEDKPLSKPVFDQNAKAMTIADQSCLAIQVLAPRLGHGTFIRRGREGVFVSRTIDDPMPEQVIVTLLQSQTELD